MSDPARIPQTRRVILVRHAQSQVEPQRDPAGWGLTPEGHAAAQRLTALALFEHAAAFYAGPEPKLAQSLAPVATTYDKAVDVDADFSETRSAGWLGDDAFQATVRRMFALPDEPPAPGWESAAQAAARFTAGMARAQARHEPVVTPGHVLPGTFAVASGGRALVSYLAAALGLSSEQAFETWRALRLPDLAVLDLPTGETPRLVIPFGALVV